mmetsp:Transcript_45281/g.129285  ORF Transcript_45281/g.129285 Transcript_45281/m.129285 type:complete len:231 (-) Transcript_45281:34-726(-)
MNIREVALAPAQGRVPGRGPRYGVSCSSIFLANSLVKLLAAEVLAPCRPLFTPETASLILLIMEFTLSVIMPDLERTSRRTARVMMPERSSSASSAFSFSIFAWAAHSLAPQCLVLCASFSPPASLATLASFASFASLATLASSASINSLTSFVSFASLASLYSASVAFHDGNSLISSACSLPTPAGSFATMPCSPAGGACRALPAVRQPRATRLMRARAAMASTCGRSC